METLNNYPPAPQEPVCRRPDWALWWERRLETELWWVSQLPKTRIQSTREEWAESFHASTSSHALFVVDVS